MPSIQADFETTRTTLATFGINVAGRTATNRADAISAAQELGFPVVMKLVSPDIIHKSDVGVVVLDIETPEAVGETWDLIMKRAKAAGAKRIDGILVQLQARPGLEVLVGARQDPCFGPVTMVGMGGRFVELFKDVWPGVGVLSREDVENMLLRTKTGRILSGYRGPALDRDAVIDLAMAVSRLMDARTDIVELDLNPVIVYEKGTAIVDARMILGEPVKHPKEEDLSYERLKSLSDIFSARSVAVVGASRPGTVGGVILRNSRRVGRIYPINPKVDSLYGIPCFPKLEALPEVPDVAVFAVRPEATIQGFETFCKMGGKGAIIVSDGFAEVGRHDLEQRLVDTAERHDVVYIGPNGLGVFDNFTGLNTMFLPRRRSALPGRAGPIGIISQSGGIGIEVLEMAAADDLPVGKWVSCGNASGVTIPELLIHMGDDPRIRIIAVYLEGIRNGLQFMQVARKIARRKPILVIKGGMAGGAAATLSHTASLAGSFEAFKAACNQAGLFLIEELTEDPKVLCNVLSMLTNHRPARGKRAAVVSAGGGAGILLADQLTSQGIDLAQFTAETCEALGDLLASRQHATTAEEKRAAALKVAHNPLDLFGDANDDRLIDSIRLLNRDPNVDLIVMALYFHIPLLTEYLGEHLAQIHEEMTKPLIMSLRGFSPYVLEARDYMMDQGAPCYTVPMVKPLTIALDVWKRYGLDFSRME